MYPDNNGDGTPDASENRPSIIQVLNSDPADMVHKRDWIDAPSEDADYRFFVGPIAVGQPAVLLEIRGVGNGARGACVFRSELEIRVFLSDLKRASAEAFGESENVNLKSLL